MRLAEAALLLWGSTVVFYILFLCYASYHQARLAGRTIPITSIVLIGPAVLFGFILDLAWNTTLGSALFAEVPWTEDWRPWTWTFTGRLKRWKNDTGWRGAEARWWATLLNWADPGHV